MAKKKTPNIAEYVVGVYDFETDKAPSVKMWGLKVEDKELVIKNDNADNFVNYLLDNYYNNDKHYLFYSHNFSNWDAPFFLTKLEKLSKEKGIKFTVFQEESVEKDDNIIFQPEKKVYCAEWGNITFLCSYLIFLSPLISLMNKEEKKIKALSRDFDWDNEHLYEWRKDELTEYLKNDVNSLFRIMTELFKKYPWSKGKMTRASMSLTSLKLFNPYWNKIYAIGKFFNAKEKKIDRFKERAYFIAKEASKGTCVNYWNKRIGFYHQLTFIDVNSMYADVEINNPMPWGKPDIYSNKLFKEIPEVKLLKDAPRDYFGFAEVWVDIIYNGNHFPFVVSNKTHKEARPEMNESGFYFPKHLKGTFFWFTPWLDLIKQHYKGKIVIREIHRYKRTRPFKEHVHFWNEKKIKAKKYLNGERVDETFTEAETGFFKGMLTGAYGKCGQEIHNLDGTLRNCFNYQPILAAVLAYARIKLYTSAIKFPKEQWIYSDTDCLWLNTTKEEVEKRLEIDDYKLGAWKIEEYHKNKNEPCEHCGNSKKGCEFSVFAPKAYSLNGKIKWKGAWLKHYEVPPQYKTVAEILLSKGSVLLPQRQAKTVIDGDNIGKVLIEKKKLFYPNLYRKKLVDNNWQEYDY